MLTFKNVGDSPEKILSNFNKAVKKIKGRTGTGLFVAAQEIKAESQRRVPVDTGNLKASHYVDRSSLGGMPVVEIGATAEYAIYVHENLEANHPNGGEAQFLLNALIAKRERALDVIQKLAKV